MIWPTVMRGLSERIGVLEDHLDLAAHRLQLGRRGGRQVAPSKRDLAAGRLFEPQDQPADRGLAAAGFADQAERLAGIDVEADVLDRAHRAAARRASRRAPGNAW